VLCICFSVFYITDAKEIEIIDVTFENSSGRELSSCLPDDEGKHPAVVGCGGWAGSLHQYNNWPQFLAENDYIALCGGFVIGMMLGQMIGVILCLSVLLLLSILRPLL
jgi:hypothetical protein